MNFLKHLTIFFYAFVHINGDNVTNDEKEIFSVNEVADGLISLLGVPEDGNEIERIKELKEKRQKIEGYVLDKDKYVDLLINKVKDTTLNQTIFYDALHGKDYFQQVANDSKNLYLKLKEKMNRDDVMQVLANKAKGKLRRSARRMMDEKYIPKKFREKRMNDVVDKMLAETPYDDHTYDENDRYNKYWDPEAELRERRDYHNNRRLYRGERTTVRYYPFMVSIHVMGRFWCGGVIYWHDIVLTSAACLQLMHNNRFFRENPKVLAVRVGSNHSRIGGELVDALEVFFHPGYNPRTLRNNMAIIRLRRHLRLSYHRVPKIINIAHNEEGIPFSQEILLLGWGVTKTSQKMAYEPIFLQRKFLPVYPNKFCKEVYGDKFITRSMFCAGTMTTGEGACDHDAGGPAILNGKLVGIISFGPSICGYPDAPTVFSLIGYYADWIETVNQSMPEWKRWKSRTTTTTKRPVSDWFTHRSDPTVPTEPTAQGLMIIRQTTTTTEEPTEETTTEEPTTVAEATTPPPEISPEQPAPLEEQPAPPDQPEQQAAPVPLEPQEEQGPAEVEPVEPGGLRLFPRSKTKATSRSRLGHKLEDYKYPTTSADDALYFDFK